MNMMDTIEEAVSVLALWEETIGRTSVNDRGPYKLRNLFEEDERVCSDKLPCVAFTGQVRSEAISTCPVVQSNEK